MAAARPLKNICTLKNTQFRRLTHGSIRLLCFQQTQYRRLQQARQRVLEFFWWLAVGSSDHVSADSWIQSDSCATSNQVNFMDSASNEWYLTGCQFELGDKATPFEHRSIGEEMILCQRYFHMIKAVTTYSPIGVGRAWSTSRTSSCYYLPTPMRTKPDH